VLRGGYIDTAYIPLTECQYFAFYLSQLATSKVAPICLHGNHHQILNKLVKPAVTGLQPTGGQKLI